MESQTPKPALAAALKTSWSVPSPCNETALAVGAADGLPVLAAAEVAAGRLKTAPPNFAPSPGVAVASEFKNPVLETLTFQPEANPGLETSTGLSTVDAA